MSYSVVYRTGGTDHCEWLRVLDIFNYDKAKLKAQEIEKMGYKSFVHDTHFLDSVGMPVGWEPQSVDWDKDFVDYSRMRTLHIKEGYGS